MEDIFTQKVNYAIISHVRNYCNLDEKDSFKYMGVSQMDRRSFEQPSELIKGWHRGRRFFIDDKHFTYANYTPHERDKFVKDYITTKERHIKANYCNPFATIDVTIQERSIRKHGDKVTIKLYHMKKKRGINSIHFKKMMSVISITFNLVTGNFTTLHMINAGKVHKKDFRTNSFRDLNMSLRKILFNHSHIKPIYRDGSFSVETFKEEVMSFFKFEGDDEYLMPQFTEMFVEKKKIKTPNIFYWLINRYYPTEKYLKKNDRKLIQSILDKHGIKSKLTNKIFHENIELCLDTLVHLCNIFGNDYTKHIGNIKNLPQRLGRTLKSFVTDEMVQDRKKMYQQLTEDQKERIVKIIVSTNKKIDQLVSEFFDHLDMIEKIRQEGVDVEFNAMSYEKFKSEHAEFGSIMSAINKGYEIQYKFKPEMVESIEKPIGNIQPFILKRDYDYTEEGGYMHHCVATYSNRESSVIVSLRSTDNDDRVTCEFNALTGDIIQKQYFSNTKPPEYFLEPLRVLCNRVKAIGQKGELKSISKDTVPLMIKGVEIKPKLKPERNEIFEDVFGAFAEPLDF